MGGNAIVGQKTLESLARECRIALQLNIDVIQRLNVPKAPLLFYVCPKPFANSRSSPDAVTKQPP